MFIIYYSNDLERLKNLLSYQIKRHINNNIFEKEFILIPNDSINKWLQFNLSEIGIANYKSFIFIEEFLIQIFKIFFNKLYILNILEKKNIFLKILNILPKIINNNNFIFFKKYFNKIIIDKFKFFKLCYKIANIYEKYMLYRIDWLTKWEKGQLIPTLNNVLHQKWQSTLWKKIVKSFSNANKKIYFSHHMYNMIIQYLEKLEHNNVYVLPKNIFVFNIFYMPIIYWQIFYKLSLHINIHFFIFNPCQNYWLEDCQNYPFKTINSKLHINKIYYFYDQKNILYKLGKTIKNTLIKFYNFNCLEINSFIYNKKKTLLNLIKQNILKSEINFFNTKIKSKKKIPIDILDNTISINICYTIQHEVEVLYNFLLKVINKSNNSIKYKNILVMVSNLSLYASAIQGKFGVPSSLLPYNIRNIKEKNDFKFFKNTLIKILKLTITDYNLEAVISILEISYIRKKFNITIEELSILYDWLKNSGIKKGLNNTHLRKLKLDQIYKKYTWEFIFKRIMLGYMGCKNITNNIIPYYPVNGISNKLIGNLSNFFMYINKWYLKLSLKYDFFTWKKHILNIQKDFFYIDLNKKNNHINNFNKLLFDAFELNKKLILKKKYSLLIIIYYLEKFLKSEKNMFNIPQNVITFCDFNHMRVIPFKVICLLGMNKKLFNNNNSNIIFDLICSNYNKEDYNKKEVKNYLFLESILAAKEIFYISYVKNYYLENNNPANVVYYLLEYIKNTFVLVNNKKIFKNKCIKSHLCLKHKFNELFNNLLYSPLKKKIIFKNIFKKKIINKNVIDWNNFLNFWKHPIKEFLKLNYSLNIINNNFKNQINLYKLRKQIIHTYINDYKKLSLLSYYWEYNINKICNYEKIIFQNEKNKLFNLFNKIKNNFIINKYRMYNLNFNFFLHGIKIIGKLYNLNNHGLIKFKLSKFNFLDYFIFYLEHLLINVTLGFKESKIYFFDNTKIVLPPISIKSAKKLLIYYFYGYFNGLKKPIFLPPRTINTIIKLIYNKNNFINKNIFFKYDFNLSNLNINLINIIFKGDNFNKGEMLEDLYIKKFFFLYKNIEDNYISILIKNIKIWLYPILVL